MSRSIRHSRFVGVTTACSEKWWKQIESRRRRAVARQAAVKGDEPPKLVRTGDRFGPKDGKRRLRPCELKLLRK